MQRDCPNAPNAWGMVGGGPVSDSVDPTLAEAHLPAASSVPTPPFLPKSSAIILTSLEAAVVELHDEGVVPVSPFSQSQSILTGLVPTTSIGVFSSSAAVLSYPDSIDSFPTQVANDDKCLDLDIHDSMDIHDVWKDVDDTVPKEGENDTQSIADCVIEWSRENRVHLNSHKCKEL